MIIGLHHLNDVSHYKLYNTQSAGTPVMESVCGLMFCVSVRLFPSKVNETRAESKPVLYGVGIIKGLSTS